MNMDKRKNMVSEDKIEDLLKAGRTEDALGLLEEAGQEGLGERLLLRWGELLYGEGRMTEALNRFNAVLRKNPGNPKAGNYAAMINRILGYYCKDMFNP